MNGLQNDLWRGTGRDPFLSIKKEMLLSFQVGESHQQTVLDWRMGICFAPTYLGRSHCPASEAICLCSCRVTVSRPYLLCWACHLHMGKVICLTSCLVGYHPAAAAVVMGTSFHHSFGEGKLTACSALLEAVASLSYSYLRSEVGSFSSP